MPSVRSTREGFLYSSMAGLDEQVNNESTCLQHVFSVTADDDTCCRREMNLFFLS